MSLLLTIPVGAQAQTTGTGTGTATSNSASNSPLVGRPGIMQTPSPNTGTQGLSSPDGQGGAGANAATAVKQTPSPTSTPTESQQGLAPAGASSEPKTGDRNGQPNSGAASGNTQGSGSRGSSANGGTAPITGSRQDNPGSVGRSVGGILPYAIFLLVLIVGLVIGFMSRMNRSRK